MKKFIYILLSLPFLGYANLDLVKDARAQVGVTTSYDGTYTKIPYPMGDVPAHTGVCTDVVIRAFRKKGTDLQKEIHEDMKKNFKDYPKFWGPTKPDTNIDHRRVPNMATYFKRQGYEQPITDNAKDYKPGDLVTWHTGPGDTVPHIGIVSDKKTPWGIPLIIHNMGWGTQEEDILFVWPITGHFRPLQH